MLDSKADAATAKTTGANATNGEARSRKPQPGGKDVVVVEERKELNPSVKLGGYLNLM